MAVSTDSNQRPGEEEPSQGTDSGQPSSPTGSAESDDTPFEGLAARPSNTVSVAEDQQMATLAHMLGIAGCLPAIVIHRWSRGRARFAEQESLEAANFTMAPTVAVISGALLGFIPYVGWVFALAAAGAWLFLAVCSMQAAIAVNKGRPFVYRFNWYLYDIVTRRRAERRAERMSSAPLTASGEIVGVREVHDD